MRLPYPNEPDTSECHGCGDPIEQTACIGDGASSLWHCSECGERCIVCRDEDEGRA